MDTTNTDDIQSANALLVAHMELQAIAEATEKLRKQRAEKDRDHRYEILESKMSLPAPKLLACPHAPPPPTDNHFPTPADVQVFLRENGIEQFDSTFWMEWWLESNPWIELHNESDSGLSRHERYKFGILGGSSYVDGNGVEHWMPTQKPEPPPSWDNPDDAVKPATPSRERSDLEKDVFMMIWKKLYPSLRLYGIRRLSDSKLLPAWLSDVRLAMLTAYWNEPNEDVSDLGTKRLPPLRDVICLAVTKRRLWEDHEWGMVFRRLARQWSEEGSRTASGSRRQSSVDKATLADSDKVLQAVKSRYQRPEDAYESDEPVIHTVTSEQQALQTIYDNIRINELPDDWQKECIRRVARSLCACPGSKRAVQIEHTGLSRSVFHQHLAIIKQRTEKYQAINQEAGK